jgi:hypothetical protein
MRLILIILIALMLPVAAPGRTVSLNSEVIVPLPDGWVLGENESDYPYQLIMPGLEADVLIYKSFLDSDEVLGDRDQLKQSVDIMIDEVILSMPETKLLTSTGFYEEYRIGFVIEFSSIDAASHNDLRHRLCGIIYLLPDGRQAMFTIWGKTPAVSYHEIVADLEMIQSGFQYTEPYAPQAFVSSDYSRPFTPLALVLVLVLSVLLYLRFKQRQKKQLVQQQPQEQWKCSCGQHNHLADTQCLLCGAGRFTEKVR